MIEEIIKNHPRYEYREGQVQMAKAIDYCLNAQNHLIVEAGTGIGKTFAYLIPAINYALNEGKRVIISTGTKNLQEQLMLKDVPFLNKVMSRRFNSSYMKGRGNYLCLHRFGKAQNQPILDGLSDADWFSQIGKWSLRTPTGDRAEMTNLPENLSFWSKINAKGDTCIGKKCDLFESCFITKMHRHAGMAEIVIVNHYLFFADLALRDRNYGKVLPDFDAVIFDEAHLIENIATDYFGISVSSKQIEDLAEAASELPILDGAILTQIIRIAEKIVQTSQVFWKQFYKIKEDGSYSLHSEIEELSPLILALKHLEDLLEIFVDDIVEVESVSRRADQMITDLTLICAQEDDKYVYWYERRGKGVYLKASPIDISDILRTKLFDRVPSAILTSATLSTNGKYDFIKRRLGLNGEYTKQITAPSAFDYRKQAIMYVPNSIPEPREKGYIPQAAEEIIKLLKISNGRAFVLSTSNYGMKAFYDIVSKRVNFPCFLQGTMSKTGLIEEFKNTPNAVLFATSSFWQGVDVQGEKLSCVIIDKLPFVVPTDPLVAARSDYIDDNGGKSFFEYFIPNAIIALKQGVGRLIRSKTDTGVIAILDTRLLTKGYGKAFIKSLPDAPVTSNIKDVERFFEANRQIVG